MSAVVRLRSTLLRRILPVVNRRLISTSQKKDETACPTAEKTVCNTTPAAPKNWMSYGFETKSEADDLNAMHSTFFASITVCIVFGGFVLLYLPDYNLRDWSQREAFIELRRREMANLPLVDPNLIDPASILLPSDEDLGDTEIII